MLTRSLVLNKLRPASNTSIFNLTLRNMSSMAQIKQLRSSTGSPIGECKKALTECDGDITKAKQWLRERGSAYADGRVERSTNQGQICLKVTDDSQTAMMLELNCETDFVAKTEIFKDGIRTYFDTLAQAEDLDVGFDKMKDEETIQKFLNMKMSKSLDPDLKNMTASEALTFIISKTRENCNIGSLIRKTLEGNKRFGSYLHNVTENNMGKIGALVVLDGEKSSELPKLANLLAMHIVAMRPEYLSEASAPEKLDKLGKSKILENQEFITQDNTDNLTVKDYFNVKGKEMGAPIKIEDFVIFSCA